MSFRVNRLQNGESFSNVGQFLHYGFEIEGQHSSTERNPDPHRWFSQTWSIIFRLSCVIAVSLDPLFFYVPVINEEKKCIELDKKLRILAPILRTFTDSICLINIALQFYNGYIDETSVNATLIKDPRKIARRYLWPYLVIDILVLLPIPQVSILILFGEVRGSKALGIRKFLTAVLLFQYVPRIIQIYLSWKDPMRKANRYAKFPMWCKAAFNFSLFIIASHVIGALWYFFSIERETACWHLVCGNQNGCGRNSFNCADSSGNYTSLDASCPINTPNTTLFDFGIFLEALQSGIVQSSNLPQKFFFCFWWGLRNLSSFGQGLQTSNYLWESCFAIFVSILRLLLFLYFLENLKTYMQLATKSSKENRKKAEKERRKKKQEEEKKRLADQRQNKQKKAKDDIQVWIQKNEFCDDIKNRINEIVDEVLEEDIYVNEENLFLVLPAELKNDIKRHLCLDILRKVPVLREKMNEPELKMICDCLKPVSYEECIYIVREGEPLDRAYFITRGTAWTYTTTRTNGEATTSSSQSKWLEKGGFFGEELIEWGLDLGQQASSDIFNLPLSSKIFKSHTKVEAYALMANDLKNMVSQMNGAASKLHAALRHNKEN